MNENNNGGLGVVLKIGHIISYFWLPISALLGVHFYLVHADTKAQIAEILRQRDVQERLENDARVAKLEAADRELSARLTTMDQELRDTSSKLTEVIVKQKEVRARLHLNGGD